MAKWAIAWGCVLVLSCSAVARADGSGAAEELFRQGKALMAEGHIAEGCAKLEESQRLDPGSGTLVNLAVCFEKLGRLARAWAEFGKVPSLARRDARPDREDFARTHISEIEPRLSWLTVVVPPSTDTLGLELSLDGVALGRGGWNTALPLDPGPHHVMATASGKIPWKTDVEIAPGPARQELVVPALMKLNLPPVQTAPPVPDRAPPAVHDASGRRAVGFIVGAVGVAALATGAVFGVLAITTNHEASNACHGASTCAPGSPGPAESRRAIFEATSADVAVGVGLAASVTAVYLVLTSQAPRPAMRAFTHGIHVDAQLELRGGGLTVTSLW
jgi:hypothetical protein